MWHRNQTNKHTHTKLFNPNQRHFIGTNNNNVHVVAVRARRVNVLTIYGVINNIIKNFCNEHQTRKLVEWFAPRSDSFTVFHHQRHETGRVPHANQVCVRADASLTAMCHHLLNWNHSTLQAFTIHTQSSGPSGNLESLSSYFAMIFSTVKMSCVRFILYVFSCALFSNNAKERVSVYLILCADIGEKLKIESHYSGVV